LAELSIPIDEYEARKIGGTDDNPIKATLFVFDQEKEKKRISIGRGREFITVVEKSGDQVSVDFTFENHHRSRGWTLRTDVIVFDEKGQQIGETHARRGLNAKGWDGFKEAKESKKIEGLKSTAEYGLVVCYRDPSDRIRDAVGEAIGDFAEDLASDVIRKIAHPDHA
jgi:hypothetical protein